MAKATAAGDDTGRTDTTKTPLKADNKQANDSQNDAHPVETAEVSDEVKQAASATNQPQTSQDLADQDPTVLTGPQTPEQRIADNREKRDAAGMDQHNVPQDNEAVAMLPPLPGEFQGKNIDPRVIPDEVWEANPEYDRAAAIEAWDSHNTA